MKQDPYCYLNGKVDRLSKLHLPLNDLGVLRAYGVFDYMRTHHGKAFLMDAHVNRFMKSAKDIGIAVPVSKAELKRIALALIKKNGFTETAIKYVVTGGPSDDGVTIMSGPTFFVIATEVFEPPAHVYEKGVHIQTLEYQRPLPEIKSLNYIISVKHQKELKKKGILELLYVHKDHVLECSSSNIFLVKNNVLIAPKNNILLGTTKRHVIALAKGTYKVVERDVKVSELKTADEVFLTAANKGVMPVTKINTFKVKGGKVGPVAKALKVLYDKSLHA